MMKFVVFVSILFISINLSDANAVSDKVVAIATKQMKKGLREAHEGLKAHNAKLIKTAFLNATNCRWKFSRISSHFSEDPMHENHPFKALIEECKTSSKDHVEEMKKLMDQDLQNEIAENALQEYSKSIEDLMKRSMKQYTDRLDKGKISCIMTQARKGMSETQGDMDELKEKFKKETENSFENDMIKYLEKMDIIETTITNKYESCYNTEDFDDCLKTFVENEKVQKIPSILSKTMQRLKELFLDGLNQVGPDIDHVEEVFHRYDDKIEELMGKCDV